MEWTDELVGLTSWGAKIGIGTFLTLELGEAYLTERNHPHGKWYIWAKGVPWRIVSGGKLIVDWEDPNLSTEQVELLNGRVLCSVLFEKSNSYIAFRFDGEVILEVFIDTPVDDFELIFLSEKESYFLNGDGEIGHEENHVPKT